MKNLFKILLLSSVCVGLVSCNDDNIDPISEVSPGEDKTAPVTVITSPSGTIWIPSSQSSADLSFNFSVTDDIEIKKVDLLFDGTKIATFDNFIDYRKFMTEYAYNSISIGSHTVTVNSEDLAGKTSTMTSNFEIKKYVPILSSETLYMPFDSNYTNLINLTNATAVGTPSLVAGGYTGNGYKGATGAYLTYPIDGLVSNTDGVSFTFRYKVNASPDRSGIITINDNANNSDENRTKGLRLLEKEMLLHKELR